ncbi:MAG: 16S rRNA (cytidine(1402)-2'-O)-methyltransferase [Bacteriovoracaceae bacterium]|nr:16S rRNA (cytidine(1402)-2'-O)-methyltransferase [Bacteriovoracaceae bacterium]
MAKLFLITLPIGNLGDLTERARTVLNTQKRFIAEDTRKLLDFMKRAGIDASSIDITSFHDQSDQRKLEQLGNALDSGIDLYLVSDAGSPIISDPAYPLVRIALDRGHEIQSIPGVSAVTTALELAGLPPHPFYFHGFIAREKVKKASAFSEISALKGTHIFFESPQRIKSTMEVLSKSLPESSVAICRELTKTFESVYRFKACDFSSIAESITCKGEFVFLVHISKGSCGSQISSKLTDLVEQYLNGKRSTKMLAKIFAEITNENSKEIYSRLS